LTYAKRNRTSAKDIGCYALYLYFLGLSLIEIHQKHYPDLSEEGVSFLSVWKWVQHYSKPERVSFKRRKISKFIVDETHKLKLDKITFGFGLLLHQ
jgi:hypothetical protein